MSTIQIGDNSIAGTGDAVWEPGSEIIENAPILRILKGTGYAGWLVVEAAQNPRKAHPLTYAANGCRTLSKLAKDAGFNVIDRKEPVVSS